MGGQKLETLGGQKPGNSGGGKKTGNPGGGPERETSKPCELDRELSFESEFYLDSNFSNLNLTIFTSIGFNTNFKFDVFNEEFDFCFLFYKQRGELKYFKNHQNNLFYTFSHDKCNKKAVIRTSSVSEKSFSTKQNFTNKL